MLHIQRDVQEHGQVCCETARKEAGTITEVVRLISGAGQYFRAEPEDTRQSQSMSR
jgi:hypothetical protein